MNTFNNIQKSDLIDGVRLVEIQVIFPKGNLSEEFTQILNLNQEVYPHSFTCGFFKKLRDQARTHLVFLLEDIFQRMQYTTPENICKGFGCRDFHIGDFVKISYFQDGKRTEHLFLLALDGWMEFTDSGLVWV